MTTENTLAHGIKTSVLGTEYKNEQDSNWALLDPDRITSGLLSARPAVGNIHRFYYATDTSENKMYYDNGTSWIEMYVPTESVSFTGATLPIRLNQNLRTSDTVAFIAMSLGDGTSLSLTLTADTSGYMARFKGRASDNTSILDFRNNGNSASLGSIQIGNDALYVNTASSSIPILLRVNNTERLRVSNTGISITGTIDVSSNVNVVGSINIGTTLLPSQIVLNGTAGAITAAGSITAAGALYGAGAVLSTALQVTSNASGRGVYICGRASDNLGYLEFLNNAGNVSYGIVSGENTAFKLFAQGNIPLRLYSNNVDMLDVSSTGVAINGALTFGGSGSMNASYLSGTIAAARLSGTYGISISGTAAAANSLNGILFGAYSSVKSIDTVYYAYTDLLVIGNISNGSDIYAMTINCYTDASNPPTTLISSVGLPAGTQNRGAICFSVRKGTYYKIASGGGSGWILTAREVPIGA